MSFWSTQVSSYFTPTFLDGIEHDVYGRFPPFQVRHTSEQTVEEVCANFHGQILAAATQ